MACANAYDTLTQSSGTPLANQVMVPNVSLTSRLTGAVVTSYCRTADGTWVAWIQNDDGDTLTSSPPADPDKTDWPSRVASSAPIGVGFFADDGSSPVVYLLGLEWPCFDWRTGPTYSDADPCSSLPIFGARFANNSRAELIGWSTSVLDVQVRTDGVNVWVAALAQETVSYPYLYGPGGIDRCGTFHAPLIDELLSEGADPFITGYAGNVFSHDTETGRRWWEHFGSPTQSDNDDPGPHNSFRWQPARVTVWAGDLAGFTRLDAINANYANDQTTGKVAGVEMCASAAEPGVCHVMWSEEGPSGTYLNGFGSRTNYSVWDAAGRLSDSDLLDVWTSEFILRNDHGSAIAFIGHVSVDPVRLDSIDMWDPAGAVILQTLETSLIPTAAESGTTETVAAAAVAGNNAAQGGNAVRRLHASSLYTDPLRGYSDVYLLSVPYLDTDNSVACVGFYRVPVDGSDSFEFLDGLRLVGYSIVQGFTTSFGETTFRSDFVSDPDNIWMPAPAASLSVQYGGILHLDRQCLRGWEVLEAFPVGLTGDFVAGRNVPEVVTRDDGDWLLGGGYGAPVAHLSTDPTPVAALEAKICRCCLPCNRTGMHVWEIV